MLTKQVIRRELIARRTTLDEQNISLSSMEVTARILNLPNWKAARRVHIYTSQKAWGEIDTEQLREYLRQRYPQLVIETSAIVVTATLPKHMYDVIIVPVLGFDAGGYRLGLGKGWYDRFLATQSQAFKIGLAYSWAQLPMLPHEPHDVPLDILVTEYEIVWRSTP